MNEIRKSSDAQEAAIETIIKSVQQKTQDAPVPDFEATCRYVKAREEKNRSKYNTVIYKPRYIAILLIVFLGLFLGFNNNARSFFSRFVKTVFQDTANNMKNLVFLITLDGFEMGEILYQGEFISYEGTYNGHSVEVHTRPYDMNSGAISNMEGEQHRVNMDITAGGEAIIYADQDGCTAFLPIGNQELIVLMEGGSIDDMTAIIKSIKKTEK